MPYVQGEIYWVNDGGATPRPYIVLSREELNRGGYATMVPVTSRNFAVRAGLPNCVAFRDEIYGLPKDSVALCEAVSMVDKSDVERGPDGPLSPEDLRALIRAMGYVMDGDCEPA